ncbi:MAG: hypothetical protein A3C80_00050 [Candidatus Ryanbacteria bacterium RIFCSPHIGHO2_02_FULL_45_43]|uniref:Uncharacterized protein n=1 Tax=Candidatus Ryanbacteria bacterium RIFCSPHIGHO2_01_45_13 TaxID=1802112 RepID=A0A1G2FUR5_9BACT|nr:MAG: hypothetical protein A2718_01435 [Candidatus Ryanbacteria bacterium RIFCSPHIGHO2_01_FULL_44_130]OGZ41813.1 MAG: hypothetical protein A2W41_00785 [Candidatus Ryanbacteria bacterium RIFCSPHIGHO2_01_45_13]OGZ47679.1 MAG: hypothetical protein A3C80_00050 [Candidatus Ryanbacteria bacterium RIFCSPHIGHO2_02_FULL_45_43]OGZ49576.1 MAG: hypothetical protein A3E55_04055 [Candidatus Ryanbacteria bacterium RIFCSPHIGHO2_12_FULL_44_20]OGZ51258.1 MAG: hypothetical protein A3A17_04380 [Candidatus Ryanba
MKLFTSLFKRDTSTDTTQGDIVDDGFVSETDVVLMEETDTVEQSGGLTFQSIARWALYLLILFLPIWFLPATIFPVEMNKAFLALALSLIALVAWIGRSLQEGRITVARSPVIWTFAAFIVVWLVASLFSQNISLSLFGFGGEPTTLITFIAGGLMLFLIPSVLTNKEHLVKAYVIILLSALLVFVWFFLRSILDIPLFGERAFNTIGSWNGLGAFTGFVLAIVFPFLGAASAHIFRKIAFIFLIIGFLATLVINLLWAWAGIGVVALIFFSLYFSTGRRRSPLFVVTFLLIITSILFVLLNSPLRSIAENFGATAEVVPSFEGTLKVAKSVLETSPVFGFGPNTFGLAWEKFKPQGVLFTPFWNVRFNQGSGTVATILVEGGIAGAVFFLIFLGLLLVSGIKAITKNPYSDEDIWDSALLSSFFSATLFLFFLWFVYPVNVTLVLLSFVVAGLFIASATFVGVGKVSTVYLFSSVTKGFVASLAMIVTVIVSVIGLYFGTAKYVSHIFYRSGLDIYNTEGSINSAQNKIQRGIEFYGEQDRYWRTLAELEIVKMNRALNVQDISEAERASRFQNALGRSIEYGRKAAEINGADPQNWRVLGRVYETAIPFIDGAESFAVQHYTKAREFSPRDPSLAADLARTHLSAANAIIQRSGDVDSPQAAEKRKSAVKFLEETLVLKNDYASAHFLLAQLYAFEGRTSEAIQRAATAFQLVPQDVGVAFQLGVLHYQAGDFQSAKFAFERAITLNEKYSNARYFLGLILATEGDTNGAIEQFENIIQLNPGNEEIRSILTNLKSEKDALEGIVPPAVSPEDRLSPPIDEPSRETGDVDIE